MPIFAPHLKLFGEVPLYRGMARQSNNGDNNFGKLYFLYNAADDVRKRIWKGNKKQLPKTNLKLEKWNIHFVPPFQINFFFFSSPSSFSLIKYFYQKWNKTKSKKFTFCGSSFCGIIFHFCFPTLGPRANFSLAPLHVQRKSVPWNRGCCVSLKDFSATCTK